MKRVFIIHGWGGDSRGDWFVWLGKELEDKGFAVVTPDMPDTQNPKISEWVNKIKELAGNVNEETYFVGHSMGCQAIMRYLEQLPPATKIGGAIFVAGWFNLTDETWDDEGYTPEIADQWINIPMDFNRVKFHSNKFVVINSDDDPYVPLSDVELFKNNLGAEIIMLKNKGHISGEDGSTDLPEVLEELLKMAK